MTCLPSPFSDYLGNCGGNHHPAADLPQEEDPDCHCSYQRIQQVRLQIRDEDCKTIQLKLRCYIVLIFESFTAPSHRGWESDEWHRWSTWNEILSDWCIYFFWLHLQSYQACDVFPFLPTIHFPPPSHGHRLLGSYCCVSFHVSVLVSFIRAHFSHKCRVETLHIIRLTACRCVNEALFKPKPLWWVNAFLEKVNKM